uniref:Uncharacterized protein n=1 Tax=viral metagenome TaxID=1070528 RepID=A0A6C0CSL5_9ZZZZ
MTDVNSAGMTNPSGGMVFFFIVTTIYTILNYNLNKKYNKDETGGSSKTYFIIYLLMVIIGEFFVNLSLTAGSCGSPQYSTALITTILPWGFMFGILVLLLSMFPGWLAPFSNTFGYGIALMAGLNDIMNDIIEPNPKGAKANPQNEYMEQALAHIYSDKSLLVNEITPTSFGYFWNNMKGIFQKGVYENQELKNRLYSLVQLKYVVAEYIWYILAGLLVTSVSYNYIINSACSMDAEEMKKRHAAYQEEMDAAHEESLNTQQNQRVYSTHE